MDRLWSWLGAHWRYLLILPALGLAWGWVRRAWSPSPAPGPAPGGPVGPEADAARDRVREEADAARLGAERRAGNDMETIRRARRGGGGA